MRTEFRPSEKPFASADTVHGGVGGVGVGNWPACHLEHALAEAASYEQQA